MYYCINSTNLSGIGADIINVESDILKGLPGFSIVGLPDTSVSEAKERVKAAIQNSGYKLPAGKITINLSPAEIKKNGSSFDLSIGLAILLSSKAIKIFDKSILKKTIFIGELALNGEIKPVKGVLPMIIECYQKGFKNFVIPYENTKEISLLKDMHIFTAHSLKEVSDFLNGSVLLKKTQTRNFENEQKINYPDFCEVKGQFMPKRALEIAAAGNHNILFLGSPGAGKTMLARRLPGILPDMSIDECIETTKIYSISGKLKKSGMINTRPFRSPHHTISDAALIGGGSNPRPGEISLAHNGVLFLDEMTEFKKSTIEVLRQPLTDKCVTISRAKYSYTYPANFMLVAAANPCPCGFAFDDLKECICSFSQLSRYRQKLSGPIMDRFDITLEISRVQSDQLIDLSEGECTKTIRNRVNNAREKQLARYKDCNIKTNSQLNPTQVKKYCKLSQNSLSLLKVSMEKFGMSARAFYKIIKLARTIADIEQNENISEQNLVEAISYRIMDKW